MSGNQDAGADDAHQTTFQDMRSQIEEKIDELIFNTFKQKIYDSKEAQKWCNDTSEVIIKLLQEINKDLKFTANMIILQKGDSGFHMSASCFWDSKNDGNFSKKYPFEDYYVIINVFGFARQ